jgi:MFS family permease
MRTTTVAWMFGVVWLAGVSGSHVKVFARMLGFNDFTFGLMAAVPFLATFAQILASVLIERTGLLKFQFLQCATIHRLCWLGVAAIPLVLPLPSAWATSAFLLVLAASSLMNALAAPAWMTWMGRLIPRRVRGRYFANRARLGMIVQAAAVIAIGLIMDHVYDPAAGDDAAAQPGVLWTICVFFVAAAAFGVTDILLFKKVPEVLPVKPAPPAAVKLGDFLVAPLRDRAFRSYVLYGGTMVFSLTVAGWYFWLNAMENLGFGSLATNVLFLVIGPLAGILSARLWGRAVDRWGRRPILILSTIGAVVSLLPWFFLTERTLGGTAGTYVVAALTCLAGGAVWTGINLAETGVILGFADGNGQSRYIAASAVLVSIGGFVGGLVGGAITQALQALQTEPIRLGPFLWNNWHAAFAVSALARALAILWLVRMPEPTAARTRDLVRMMGANTYNVMRTRIFFPLRVFGWRRPRPGTPEGRGEKPE